MASLRRAQSHELQVGELQALRRLLDEAFEGDFGDTDWTNSLGGIHVIVEQDGLILSHASVVPRKLRVDGREVGTGYVEAVATRPEYQRQGHGTHALEELSRVISERYEIGALSTGVPLLYGRLGWELWHGPTFVSTPNGLLRTAEEDGSIMVLQTPATGPLDLGAALICDWREGDVW